jgi:succinate dehydrogenase/fumarate reductase flavoprotein subunit
MSDVYAVVVVGAGTSGIPCALGAAAAGARVVVLEKAADIGGTLHVSGGHLSAAGTRRQRGRGIADTPEAHLADVLRISRGTARRDILELAVRLAPGTVDWLEAEGFEFDPATPRIVYGHEPYSTPRTYYGPEGGRSILAVLRRLLAASGIEVRLGVRVERLLGEAGRVAGAGLAGGAQVRAPHSVLATGGYGANPELFRELDGAPLVTAAMPGSTVTAC